MLVGFVIITLFRFIDLIVILNHRSGLGFELSPIFAVQRRVVVISQRSACSLPLSSVADERAVIQALRCGL